MRALFADTGYLVALANPEDFLHEKAKQFASSLDSARIVTSEMVLTEVLNYFSERGTSLRQAAIRLIERLRANPTASIVPQTSAQFQEAFFLYASRTDKSWSHTDCASFQIMEREGIAEALTHDRHFEQSGFRALLRD